MLATWIKGRVRYFGCSKTVVRHVAPDADERIIDGEIVAMDESGAYSDWNDKAGLRQLFSKNQKGGLLSNPRFCQ